MPLIFEQPTLSTRRLRIRPYAAADAAQLQVLAGARAVADTTLRIPHPYPDGAALAFIESTTGAWQAGTHATFAICAIDDGALLGSIGLVIDAPHARAELGYWLGVPYWGHGFATEASAEIVAFGFDALQLHRIEASHLTRNPASGRVLEKVGMRREGVRRGAVKKWGVFEDVATYAVLRSERRPA